MKKTKIKWLPDKTGRISQIYSTGLEFAFATKTKQATDFVFCKDFLHDCVYALLNEKKIKPYGFNYDPKQNPIGLKHTYILVGNKSDNKMKDRIENCLDFLNQTERKLKLRRTTVYECENPPSQYANCGVYLFRGSGMWTNAPAMMSLYSLFIRIGMVHKVGDDFMKTIDNVQEGITTAYQKNDSIYLKQSRLGIDKILELGYRKFFYKETKKNYPDIDVDTIHNNFGIVGFTQLLSYDETKKTSYNYKPTHMDKAPKYWYRKSLKKLFAEKQG
jgi:hypothetical protein